MSRRTELATVVLVSTALSAFIGWMDFHAEEVQGTVLLLIAAAGILAFLSPRTGWISALILGLGPQVAAIVGRALDIPPRYPMTPAYGGLLALIPSAIGAFIGTVVRQAVSGGPAESRR